MDDVIVISAAMYARVFGKRAISSASRGLRLYGTMFGDHCPLIITPAQLHNLKNDPSVQERDLVVLDASWHMPNSPRKAKEEWLQMRIPGSRFLDLDEVASQHPLGLKHMMPSPEVFAQACGAFPASLFVCYNSLSSSQRTWVSHPNPMS